MYTIRSRPIGSLLALALAAVLTGAPALGVHAAHPAGPPSVSQNRLMSADATPARSTWQKICQKLATYPGSSTVIIKRKSDAASTGDNRYGEVMRKCHNAHQRFVGYVGTGYTRVSLTQVMRAIDVYYDRYPDIDGIFLGDMATNPDAATESTDDAPELTVREYYRRIFVHVRMKNMTQAWVLSTTRLPRTNYVIGDSAADSTATTAWQLSTPAVVDNLVEFGAEGERLRRLTRPTLPWDDDRTRSSHVVFTVTPHTGGISARTAQQLSPASRR